MKRIRASAVSLLQRLRAIPAERRKLFLLLLFPVLVFTVVTATDAYRDWKRAGGDLPLNCTYDREHNTVTIYAQNGTRIDHYDRFDQLEPPLPVASDMKATGESDPQSFSFQLFEGGNPECLNVFVYLKGKDSMDSYEFYINHEEQIGALRIKMCQPGGRVDVHTWLL